MFACRKALLSLCPRQVFRGSGRSKLGISLQLRAFSLSGPEELSILNQLKQLDTPSSSSKIHKKLKNPNSSSENNSTISSNGLKNLSKSRNFPSIPIDSFASLGISEPLQDALHSLNIFKPTAVQEQIIPRLLSSPYEDVLMLSRTGSGKTLAFLVPAFEKIHIQEKHLGQGRTKVGHPRVVILSPTRELSEQIIECIKGLSVHSKVASIMLNGGDLIGKQRRNLSDKPYDIVVASPNRLLEHAKSGAIQLISTHTMIIDEVDTMLTQGFGEDIREIIRLARKKSDTIVSGNSSGGVDVNHFNKLQIIAATATMTKAVKSMFSPIEAGAGSSGDSNISNKNKNKNINHSSSSSGGSAQVSLANFNILGMSDKSLASLNPSRKSMLNQASASPTSNSAVSGGGGALYDKDGTIASDSNIRSGINNSNNSNQINISIVSMSGLHKPLPNVKYEFIRVREYHSKNFSRGNNLVDENEAKNMNNKIDILVDKLRILNKSNKKTLVFCNTVKSCRAVMHALEAMDSAELNLPTNVSAALKPSSGGVESEQQQQAFSRALFTYHGDLSGDERSRQLNLFKSYGLNVAVNSNSSSSSSNSNSRNSSGISDSGISNNSSNKSQKATSSSSSSSSSRASVLVATDLAARGIDIPMIDNVVLFDFPLNPIDFIHRSGRCGRMAKQLHPSDNTQKGDFEEGGEYQKGLVVSIVSKRDEILADAVKSCIENNVDIEQLSSSKKDYEDHGKYAHIMGRLTREEAFERELDNRRLLSRITSGMKSSGGSGGAGGRSRSRDDYSSEDKIESEKIRRANKERVDRRLETKHREKRGKKEQQQVSKQTTRLILKNATGVRRSHRAF